MINVRTFNEKTCFFAIPSYPKHCQNSISPHPFTLKPLYFNNAKNNNKDLKKTYIISLKTTPKKTENT